MRAVARIPLAIWTLACLLSGAELTLPDLNDRPVQPLRLASSGTTVFLFTRTDCPISNRYAPEVNRLAAEFPNARFWLVYVEPHQTTEALRKHASDYGYRFSALYDSKHELVRLTEVSVTPEAAVFTAGKLVYRGRIDDRYVAFGKSRQTATVHDLEQVLQAATAGKPVPFRETKSVGCFIEDLK